jgi:hypothetical protein
MLSVIATKKFTMRSRGLRESRTYRKFRCRAIVIHLARDKLDRA